MKPRPDVQPARSSLRAIVFIGALCIAQQAFAHAGPQVRNIHARGSGQAPLLLSNRGLIFSTSGMQDWALMCNDALGINTAEIPELAYFADGRIMAATTKGLQASADNGCSWQGVDPYGTLSTPSLAQDLGDPQRVFVTTFGDGNQSGVSSSSDGGKTWQRVFSVDDKDFLGSLLIAPSKPERIYMRSLNFGSGSTFSFQVLRSDDAGKNWERADIALTDSETDLVLLGVSPYDPDFVIGMAEAADPISNKERLLVSHDAGKTFVDAASIQTIAAVTWSHDQKTIYVAADEGLLRSSDGAQSFQRVGPAQWLSCVQELDGVLLACGYYNGIAGGVPGIGMSADGGETFSTWMNLNAVGMPIQCDAQAPTATTCAPLWLDWEREILGTVPGAVDAGVANGGRSGGAGSLADAGSAAQAGRGVAETDAGPAAGGGAHAGAGSGSDAAVGRVKKLSTSSCGCQLARSGGFGQAPALWVLGGVFLLWRRGRLRRRFAWQGVSN
jgi:hypothetical protein